MQLTIKKTFSYTLSLCLAVLFTANLDAQKTQYLTSPKDGFSKKKTTYITLMDGTEAQGTIKKLKRSKWLFEEVHLEADGKKHKIKAKDIKFMYLPQSGWDKIDKALGVASNATEWQSKTDANEELIKDGYAYFETTEVYIKKKKKETLLLQLLNPAFGSKVKVFHDPSARERGGLLSVGGIALTETYENSYYIKIDNNAAYKLKKKDYKKQASNVFGACPGFVKSMDTDWKKLGETLFNYSQSCD